MNKVKLELVGMAELRAALQNLPEDLTREAAEIVEYHANLAKGQVQSAYPVRSTGLNPGPKRKSKWFPPGALKGRVSVIHNAGRRLQALSLIKGAPHGWIYEYGTVERRHKNGKSVGAMPPAPDAQKAVPKFVRIRRRMVIALIALVRRSGFTVAEAA